MNTAVSGQTTDDTDGSKTQATKIAGDFGKASLSRTIALDQAEIEAIAEDRKATTSNTIADGCDATRVMRPVKTRSVSKITMWLQHIVTSTFDNRTTADFDDHSRVNLDDSANIDATAGTSDDFGDLSDNFDVLDEIASGGQGSISKAFDKHCARIVAVKTLHKKYTASENARRLFLTEAKITAQLDHPSVVPIYGIYGDGEKGLHLAMKMVHGRSLQEYLDYVKVVYRKSSPAYIRRCEADNLKKRLGFFVNVAEAMAYVHHKELIHKDLKPENIMLGAFGETYVMDWGIAEKVNRDKVPKKPSGTLQYIAPEVINCQPYDTRSDIYQLGLILYEIAFLKPAYESTSNEEAIQIARDGDVGPFVHKFKCPVDSDLVYIIDKALAIDPDARYQKAEQLARDVRAYLQGDVVSASPYQRTARLFRCFRRHVKLFCFLSIFVLAFFFGTNFFLIDKAYGASQRRLKEKNTMEKLAASSFGHAMGFKNTLGNFERKLQNMALEVSLRMEMMADGACPDVADKTLLPYDKTPENAIYSPTYDFRNVSFDHAAYKTQPDTPDSSRNRTLAAVRYLFPSLVKYTRESYVNYNSLLVMDEQERTMYMTQNHKPFLYNIYFGTPDGTFVTYPFVSGYNDDYDHRTKTWYTGAEKQAKDQIFFSEPYIDSEKCPSLLYTFSIPVYDKHDTLLGVLAMDVTQEYLRSRIENGRNRQQRFSRTMLLSREGQIMLDSRAGIEMSVDNSRPLFYTFPERDVFNHFTVLKNAVITPEQSQSTFLYVYAYLESIDMFLVERINFLLYTD